MAIIVKYAFRGCTVEPVEGATNSVRVAGPCHECGKPLWVCVAPADLDRFRRGEFAQDCFPYLGPSEREFLISGICDPCWDEMFPSEDDDA